ncbi:MAG: alpha-ketoacid dehydrogenase subunit beta [Candidatus Bathyarchaeia archaeon]
MLTFVEAVREALTEEMRRDEKVFVMGEDVGKFGGVFKVTKGLLEEFGPERVRDTPLSENAIVGAAVGAALMGYRPVAEVMYMDFLNECADQLVNHLPKLHFMTGGKLTAPVVIRTQYSLGRNTGAQHSQCFPAFYMNTPGLMLAMPSTPADAKGLLKTAIRGNNPVLFVESAILYSSKGEVPEDEFLIPFGCADIKRQGEDVTLVAISRLVGEALAAADALASEGISVEVVDPRTLVPLDANTIISSVRKTGRLVTAEDSCRTSGVGAEILARVMENAMDYLEGVGRVACPDIPAPFSPPLQSAYMPTRNTIISTIKSIMS